MGSDNPNWTIVYIVLYPKEGLVRKAEAQRKREAAERRTKRIQFAAQRAEERKARKRRLEDRFLREMDGHPALDEPGEGTVLFGIWLRGNGLSIDEDDD